MRIAPTSLACLALLFATATGCVSHETLADDWLAAATAAEPSAPLGGEALAQRKRELDRSYRDVVHFHSTYASLYRRGDRSGRVMFGEFADFYVQKHVLPMLEGEWQSRHPEVAILDLNLRLAVAALWIEMDAGYRTGRMIEEIERRYAGRGDMMVAYPLGSQGTLRDGLTRLRSRSGWDS